jgi:O-antigen/teichoic acid export membrane protein
MIRSVAPEDGLADVSATRSRSPARQAADRPLSTSGPAAPTPVMEPGTSPPGTGARSAGTLLLRDSSVYLAGNLLQKATAFVLIPLYTNALSTSQYGLLELANTLVNLLLVAAALGVPSAINKCFHRDCADETDRRTLVGTAVLFSVMTAGSLALAGWLLEARLAGLIYSGPEGLLVYRFTLVWLVLAQLSVIPFEFFRTSGRAHAYVGLSLIQLLVQFGCVLYLVLGLGMGLAGVLAGNVAGLLAVNLAGAFVLVRRTVWRIDDRLLKAMLSYGTAMIPVFVSGWIVNLSDRFFVQSIVGLGALGVYALGYKFGALVDLLMVMPFQRAWTPIFFRMAGDPGAPRLLARVTTYLAGVLAFASLAISLAVAPFLRLTAAPEFRVAAPLVPVVCLAYIVGGLANCLGNGLVIAERLRLVAGYAALAAVANLALNAALIPWMGMWGAAVATVLAFAVQLSGIMVSLARHYPVPIEWGRLVGIAVAAAAPLLAAALLPPLDLLPDIAARLFLLAAFPILITLTGVVRREEIGAARREIVVLVRRLRGTGVDRVDHESDHDLS